MRVHIILNNNKIYIQWHYQHYQFMLIDVNLNLKLYSSNLTTFIPPYLKSLEILKLGFFFLKKNKHLSTIGGYQRLRFKKESNDLKFIKM